MKKKKIYGKTFNISFYSRQALFVAFDKCKKCIFCVKCNAQNFGETKYYFVIKSEKFFFVKSTIEQF
jgi:hypothetical protein